MTAIYHTSGNSFIVCTKHYAERYNAATLCRAHGVDGMVVLEQHDDHLYLLSFFNSDGSQFKMCFNGSLCAAACLRQYFGARDHVHFFTAGFGHFDAIFSGDEISLSFEMPQVNIIPAPLHEPKGTCYSISLTDNHKVVLTTENFFDSPAFTPLAQKLRAADDIFEAGANVHFIFSSGAVIYIRHFEKGIEKETLSCGSGCVAAAVILNQHAAIEFISPGGRLRIDKITGRHWLLSGKPCLVSAPKLQ